MSLIVHNGIHQCRINGRFLCTSQFIRNYYQVLKLPKDCTHKDIKDSFIKLSKEHHPDRNKNKDAHKKFLEINEAYKVLSKPESRRLYDLSFSRTTLYTDNNDAHIHYRGQYGTDPWKDPSFYANRDKSRDQYYQNRDYYGIRGLKKVSNFTVAVICVSIAMIIFGIQILAVRYSFTLRRHDMIRRSNDAEESLKQLSQTAKENGNDLQLEILKTRLENIGKYK